jgi:hypothetical protein
MCNLHSHVLMWAERISTFFLPIWDLVVKKFKTTSLWSFSYISPRSQNQLLAMLWMPPNYFDLCEQRVMESLQSGFFVYLVRS